MIDIIVSIILVAIIGGAVTYIVRAKKKGQKCIGCPYAKICKSQKEKNNSCCNCHNE